jgi:hypothetical protein
VQAGGRVVGGGRGLRVAAESSARVFDALAVWRES